MIHRNNEGKRLYLFDRSRLETAAECPRKRFWLYEFLGIGIIKLRDLPPYWPFITGKGIHYGIELILKGMEGKEAATQASKSIYDEWYPLITGKDIDPGLSARMVMELEQEVDLIKGMVYGWFVTRYPHFMAAYAPVEEGIEQEEEISWILSDPGTGEEIEMRLMTRTDCLVKSLLGPTVLLVNFKSTKDPSQRWRDSFTRDMQTMTEALAVEDRLGVKVDGVMVEGLVKGSAKEWPKGSGFYQYNNPLIYSWIKEPGVSLPGEAPQGREYAPEWEYQCTSSHTMGNNKHCPGGRNHTLGKGWTKQAVSRCFDGGVFAWIDYLVREYPSVLESYFVQLPPIIRDQYQIETWKRCKLASERERQDKAALVNQTFIEGDKQKAYVLLDHYFDRFEGWQCKGCAYETLCWEAGDPFDESKWAPRVPNHKVEGEMLVSMSSMSSMSVVEGE